MGRSIRVTLAVGLHQFWYGHVARIPDAMACQAIVIYMDVLEILIDSLIQSCDDLEKTSFRLVYLMKLK